MVSFLREYGFLLGCSCFSRQTSTHVHIGGTRQTPDYKGKEDDLKLEGKHEGHLRGLGGGNDQRTLYTCIKFSRNGSTSF